MSNFHLQLKNIGILTGGFLACGAVAGIMTMVDRTGNSSMILIITGALAYMYFLLKFIVRMVRPSKSMLISPGDAFYIQRITNAAVQEPKSRLPVYLAFVMMLALLAVLAVVIY